MWPEYMVVESLDFIPLQPNIQPREMLRKVYQCYYFARECEMSGSSYRIGVRTRGSDGVCYVTRKEFNKHSVDPIGYLAGGKAKMVDVNVSEQTKTIVFLFEENSLQLVNPELVARPEGVTQANFDRHKEQVQKIVDELQACMVLMGGGKITAKELGEMTLAQILFVCAGNEISAKFGLKSLPRTFPLLT